MKNLCSTLAVSMCLSLGAGAAQATLMTFDTVDNGWYTQAGAHTITNQNTWTGTDGSTYRNSFYNFDLIGIPSGQVVTSASITFYGGNGQYMSRDAFETVQIWDVTTTPGLGNSVSVYDDLMSGILYGQTNVFSSYGASMPTFSVDLDSAAFDDILAGGFFSVGAHISTLAPSAHQVLWSSSYFLPAAYLTVNLGNAVPEPGSLALLGAALAGLGALRRRKIA